MCASYHSLSISQKSLRQTSRQTQTDRQTDRQKALCILRGCRSAPWDMFTFTSRRCRRRSPLGHLSERHCFYSTRGRVLFSLSLFLALSLSFFFYLPLPLFVFRLFKLFDGCDFGEAAGGGGGS